ncbi:hypothetical protein C2845_PM03G09710 [Panicum miliaceum]|uniref:Ubiquitin-like protease family profile domain-containing protein n=1 Tax=Panicum miliaceum TaxID=4540 RepID=A0A3L6TBT0_PANMI|nr:hypothetical protein C2845_PM03G09710 [Panicum miliaceum]
MEHFTDDYILTEANKEALNFIRHSYEYAVVVDVAGILLTVKFLQPHIKDGWLLDVVIDAYAYIANIEDSFTSVITTTQSQELSGDHGDFDPKHESAWISRIGYRCAMRQMVFVPYNVWGCHWCLLVVNNTKQEIQILNSLAGVPHFCDEKKEITLVENLQACIEAAVEVGLVTLEESIDLTAWRRECYTDIPKQKDSNSCGVYVLKYMLEWNGVQMRNNFTKKELYLAANPKDGGSDGEVCIIGTRTSNINHNTGKMSDNKINSSLDKTNDQVKPSQGQKKRGRPRKDVQNTKAATKTVTKKSEMTTVARDPGANKRISIPSQYRKSPYNKP